MKKLFLGLFILLASFTLVACGNKETDAEKVAAAKQELRVRYTVAGDSATKVTGKVALATKVNDVTVTWVSSNEAVISVAGEVVRGEEDVEVTLTATLKLGEEKDTKKFTVVVAGTKEDENKPSGSEELVLPEEFTNAVEGKQVYVTSIGQGGELATFTTLLSRYVYNVNEAAEYESKVDDKHNMLTASEVPNGSVVILIVGVSGKGLGSAGTDVAKEEARAKAFGAKAKAGDIDLYVVHIGGQSRRGNDTDPLIAAAVENAAIVLIEASGNFDGYFTTLVKEHLYEFEAAMDMVPAFKQIFNKHVQ